MKQNYKKLIGKKLKEEYKQKILNEFGALEENIFQKVKNVVTGRGFRTDAQIANSNQRRAQSIAAVAEVRRKQASADRQKQYDTEREKQNKEEAEIRSRKSEESIRADRLAKRAQEAQTRFGGRTY